MTGGKTTLNVQAGRWVHMGCAGLFLWLLLAVWTVQVSAQEADYTTWAKVGVKHEVLPALTLSGNLEWRTKDNVGMTDRWGIDAGASVKLFPFLKVGGGYEVHYRNRGDEGWKFRHRYHFDGTVSGRVHRFKLSLRERFQHTFDKDEKEFRLRSRLKLAYDIARCKLEPYVSVEMYNGLGRGEDFEVSRMRYRGGLSFPLTSKWEAEAFYCRQWERDGKKNIFGVECVYRF